MYRLMIVEDEEVNRWGLKEHIPWADYGFQVVGEAENGKCALDLIPRLRPDVILTDIMMPVMNGIELLAQVNELYNHIKVVVLSGYSEFEYARQCIDYKAFNYLVKPTEDNEIKNVFLKAKKELDISSQRSAIGDSNSNTNIIQVQFRNMIRDIIEGRTDGHNPVLSINNNNYYAVMTLQIHEHHWPKANVLIPLFNRFSDKYEELESCDIIQVDEDLLNLAITVKRDISRTTCIGIATEIRDMLKQKIISPSIRISVGIGKTYSDLTELRKSFIEASQTLKNKFYGGLGSVHHCDDVESKRNDRTSFQDPHGGGIVILMKSIIEYTVSCQMNLLQTSIDRYFEYMEGFKVGEEENIFMNAVEILIMLSIKLNEYHLELSRVLDKDVYKEIRRIIDKETLSDLKEWMYKICSRISKCIISQEEDNNPIIVQAKKYINDHYDRKITLDEVCEFLYITPSYFCSLFKLKTGYTFMGYLTAVRMSKARQLLMKSDMRVYEVAVAVGYDDFRHFSKMFKKTVGLTPMYYKEKNTGIQV